MHRASHLVIAASLGTGACARSEPAVREPVDVAAAIGEVVEPEPEPALEAAAEPVVRARNDERWHPLVRAVAANYRSWGAIDGEARWAPGLCRMPMPPLPRQSRAARGRHADKVYFVYAKDPAAYGARDPAMYGVIAGVEQAQQVLVKEAFSAAPADSVAADRAPAWVAAQRAGLSYGPGEFRGLYLMMRFPEGTPGTDRGWVYATIAADRKTVTSAGRVQSCMSCHRSAPHGRLFGIDSKHVDRSRIRG